MLEEGSTEVGSTDEESAGEGDGEQETKAIAMEAKATAGAMKRFFINLSFRDDGSKKPVENFASENLQLFFGKLQRKRQSKNHPANDKARGKETNGDDKPRPNEGKLTLSFFFLALGVSIVIRVFIHRVGVVDVHMLEDRAESINEKIKGSEMA